MPNLVARKNESWKDPDDWVKFVKYSYESRTAD